MTLLSRQAALTWAVARKDLVSELRGKSVLVGTLFFAALTLFIFGFALGPDRERLRLAAPGLLWLALVLSGVLAVGRLHQLETEDGALEQLGLYPVPRPAIFAGKALAGMLAMLGLSALLAPAAAVLYSVDVGTGLPALLAALVLGSVGFAAVGTLYAGLTARLRAREVLLPLLVLPAVAPLLLAGVTASTLALQGDPFGELGAWLELLLAYDLAMLVAGGALYGVVLED